MNTGGSRHAEVLIVGMGPVGKLLAIQLGQQGHSVIVVDRNDANYPLPRAVTHCSDVARILQSIGLAPDTISHITEPFDGIYSWRNREGDVLLEVDWGGRGESGWCNTYFFHQPDLEDAFDGILAGLPSVTVMRPWAAVSLTQRPDAVSVVVESATGGAHSEITADWLIGADGANSTVRGLLDVEWRDEGYFHDWLVVDVKLRDGGPGFPHTAAQQCDPSRPSTMVPAGPTRRRWEFMRLPHESSSELDCADKAWELLAPYGLTPHNATLERHSVYTFRACWATEWRIGRTFLIGDAAHLMPPFAGQGLGAGFRDAHNLAWKLSAVLRGVAAEPLLDTYGSERQHHALAFITFSTELGRVVCITDPQEAAIRDRRMIVGRQHRSAPSAPPRPGLGTGLHIGPHGGTLARQGRIRTNATDPAELFDDILGGAGAVIARDADVLDGVGPGVRAALHALDIGVVALSDRCGEPGLIEDVDGVYRQWLDELDADSVLVRPDFHVYGSASAHDTENLIRGFLAATRMTNPPIRASTSRCGYP